jgi:hypothetical protein
VCSPSDTKGVKGRQLTDIHFDWCHFQGCSREGKKIPKGDLGTAARLCGTHKNIKNIYIYFSYITESDGSERKEIAVKA